MAQHCSYIHFPQIHGLHLGFETLSHKWSLFFSNELPLIERQIIFNKNMKKLLIFIIKCAAWQTEKIDSS